VAAKISGNVSSDARPRVASARLTCASDAASSWSGAAPVRLGMCGIADGGSVKPEPRPSTGTLPRAASISAGANSAATASGRTAARIASHPPISAGSAPGTTTPSATRMSPIVAGIAVAGRASMVSWLGQSGACHTGAPAPAKAAMFWTA
jgi:hypothetical protein